MELFILSFALLTVLTACNFKEGVKDAGDGVQEGVQNVDEALKTTPAEFSDASNKAEADIKK